MKRVLILAPCALALFAPARAQISITSVGSAVTENFDSYVGSIETLPSGWSVSATGTLVFRGTNAGSATSGGAYAYGNSTEHSLGSLGSGTSGTITSSVSFINTTGATITGLTISWDYEQWRYVSNSGLSVAGTGALAGNGVIAARSITGSSSGSNGTPTITNVSITLSGLAIANASTFGLAWSTVAPTSGSHNGLAVDNFSVAAVPEPGTYAALSGAIAFLAAIAVRRLKKSSASTAEDSVRDSARVLISPSA